MVREVLSREVERTDSWAVTWLGGLSKVHCSSFTTPSTWADKIAEVRLPSGALDDAKVHPRNTAVTPAPLIWMGFAPGEKSANVQAACMNHTGLDSMKESRQ
jgi:hypothetical protein